MVEFNRKSRGRAVLLAGLWLVGLLAFIPDMSRASAHPATSQDTACSEGLPSQSPDDACLAELDLNSVLLPDLVPLPPTDLVIIGRSSAATRQLRLSTSFGNEGPGRLELIGVYNPDTGKTAVSQQLFGEDDAAVATRPAGEFIYHPNHYHWHMEDFVHYELWTLTSRGLPDEIVAVTGKVSFCLRDISRIRGKPARQSRYYACGPGLQGISSGWVDTYTYDTPGQIINIAGLPDGLYSLRLVVDPLDHILEVSNSNNTVREIIQITGRQVKVMDDPEEIKTILAGKSRQSGKIQ